MTSIISALALLTLSLGKDFIRALEKWLKMHPAASAGDRAAAENILRNLKEALGL